MGSFFQKDVESAEARSVSIYSISCNFNELVFGFNPRVQSGRIAERNKTFSGNLLSPFCPRSNTGMPGDIMNQRVPKETGVL